MERLSQRVSSSASLTLEFIKIRELISHFSKPRIRLGRTICGQRRQISFSRYSAFYVMKGPRGINLTIISRNQRKASRHPKLNSLANQPWSSRASHLPPNEMVELYKRAMMAFLNNTNDPDVYGEHVWDPDAVFKSW